MTEQEQVELLKTWIKQYAPVVALGILLAIGFISGWRYWQERQYKYYSHASSVYDEMLLARAQNNAEATDVQANKVFSHYTNTSYGQLAAFMLAKSAVANKNYPEAEKQLRWVIDNSKISSLKQIARLRLARILIATKRSAEATKLLETIDDKIYLGLIDEIRGDAALAENQTDAARDAYKKALGEIPDVDSSRPLLQMKYDNLALTYEN